MSVQRQTATPTQAPPVLHATADLETTAELPALDVEAYEARVSIDRLSSTDTWTVPQTAEAAPQAVDESAGHELRLRLEGDLKSLSANLRDVEERLASKGERLNVLESELAGVRGAHAGAVQRAEDLVGELTTAQASLAAARAEIESLIERIAAQEAAARTAQSRDSDHLSSLAERERALGEAHGRIRDLQMQAAAQLEALQLHEGRRGIFEGLLRGLDSEVGASESHRVGLQRTLDAHIQQVRELEVEMATRVARIGALEAEVNNLASALAKRDQELSGVAQANQSLTAELRALTELKAQQTERLKVLEAELGTRTQAHSEALRASGDLQRELEADAASRRRELETLEASLTRARAEAEERGKSLEELRAAQAQQAELQVGAEARASQLESQLTSQDLAVRTLHAELRERAERAEAIKAELRAAAEAREHLEGQLRDKTARIEELTRTGEEWRATLEAARQALAERDALIRRLETEAANSAALLDNIQYRIGGLDPPTLGVEPAPEGATRLLIRTEGEVVHVLGRKTTVGRTPDNDLQIDTKFISRHHAVILAGPVHTIIEDLNSTNGVVINGRRVTRQTLKDGDHVIIGKTQFRFATRPAR